MNLRNLKRKEKGKCKRKKEKNSVGTTSAFLPPRQPILHRPNLAIGADLGALPVMGTGRAGPPAHANSMTRRCQVGSPARFFSSTTDSHRSLNRGTMLSSPAWTPKQAQSVAAAVDHGPLQPSRFGVVALALRLGIVPSI